MYTLIKQVFILGILWTALLGGCKKDSTPSNPIYGTVGPGGGVVFYDKGDYTDGWRYMEILSYGIGYGSYGCTGTEYTNCFALEIGSGLTNTENILLAEDTLPLCFPGSSAARLCADFQQNGYSDWFLPSKNEFHEAIKNLWFIGNPAHFCDDVYCGYRVSSDIAQPIWDNGTGTTVQGKFSYTMVVCENCVNNRSLAMTTDQKHVQREVRPVRRY